MQSNTQSQTLDNRIDIDEVSIIKGILRQWWVILLVTVGTYMLAYVYVDSQYVPQYTTSTTFIVTQQGAAYSAYVNTKNAQDTANKFTLILGSNVLQKKVAQELGMESLNAKVSAKVIPETNLIVLSVTASSAFDSFRILQSMLENHHLVSEYLLSDVILDMIQAPAMPTAPVNASDTSRTAMMVAALTCVLLMVIFGGLGMLRDTVKNSNELTKKLDADLLGVICHERKHKTLRNYWSKEQISMLITNPVLSFKYVENYQLLAARIRSRMKQNKQKVLIVTSVIENEGKSTVAANIALSIANSMDKVLLIDCDLRKPAQYKIFEVKKGSFKDLDLQFAEGDSLEDMVVKLGDTNVYGILNSDYKERSTERIEGGAIQRIIAKAREQYDFIIIDSSPMALVADAEALAKYADASVLVVKQDYVLAKDLNDTIDILNAQKAKFIGCVLNSVPSGWRSRERGYGYGYSHYGYSKRNVSHGTNITEEK